MIRVPEIATLPRGASSLSGTWTRKHHGRRKHISEIENSHTPATTPKRGVTGEKATRPVKEHDQMFALCPPSAYPQELCFTRGSTAFYAAGTSTHSAGTMPLVQKAKTRAFIKHDAGEPSRPGLRPASARCRRQQISKHGVVLTFLEKKNKCCSMMDESSQPLSSPAPSQWMAAQAQCTDGMSRDKT